MLRMLKIIDAEGFDKMLDISKRHDTTMNTNNVRDKRATRKHTYNRTSALFERGEERKILVSTCISAGSIFYIVSL